MAAEFTNVMLNVDNLHTILLCCRLCSMHWIHSLQFSNHKHIHTKQLDCSN